MTQRDFISKASAVAVASGSELAMAQALLPRYAEAHTVWFTDERINAMRADYEKALQASKASFEMYTYEGTRHVTIIRRPAITKSRQRSLGTEQLHSSRRIWDRGILSFCSVDVQGN